MKYYQAKERHNPTTRRFMFATGIECSNPTIEVEGKRVRRDQLEECKHYQNWRTDFHLVKELGIKVLRYSLPLHKTWLWAGKYDWEWADQVLPVLKEMGIVPIMDLCHFGLPDFLGNFQNPEFPDLFADYCCEFAKRYPWIRLYTPVNEMYIAAEFSASYGWWNERLRSHKAFVTALKHLVRANVNAMLAILQVRKDALFIQSESSEYTHAGRPFLTDEADMLNERRFLSLDLNYGKRVSSGMYEYLLDNGMTQDEYDFFLLNNLNEHCVMGNDYYAANEHLMVREGESVYAGEVFGYYVITRDYYDRYNLPVMNTETNREEPDAERWLWKIWANIKRLRDEGVPLVGMTWYSLTDQVDWDTALRELNYRENPLGLYDLNRNIRPVGRAYKRLIEDWENVPMVPFGPLSLLGRISDGMDDEGDYFEEVLVHESENGDPRQGRVSRGEIAEAPTGQKPG